MSRGDFAEQVAQLRSELARLQEDLRAADASGNRRAGLAVLGRMLELQGAFFRKWKVHPAPREIAGSDPRDELP
jgi:hypothetical protein